MWWVTILSKRGPFYCPYLWALKWQSTLGLKITPALFLWLWALMSLSYMAFITHYLYYFSPLPVAPNTAFPCGGQAAYLLTWQPLWQSHLVLWCTGNEPACQCTRRGLGPWVGKTPWRRKWKPTPLFLTGKSHGQRSLAGYSPWGRKESDTIEHTCLPSVTSVLSPDLEPLVLEGAFLVSFSEKLNTCNLFCCILGQGNRIQGRYQLY